MDRIKPLSVTGKLKICFYGQSGSGKTTLAATFPKPILWILASGGKQPGELRSINTPEYRKSIFDVELQQSDELRELYDLQRSEEKFATIVLDHATGMQDLVLREILGLEELPEQKSWGMASRDDYGQCSLKMKELLRGLLDLNNSANIVINAQEREFNVDEDSELITPYVCSAVQPGVLTWLNPTVDYIVQTFKRGKHVTKEVKIKGKVLKKKERVQGAIEYCARLGPHDAYITKFRVPLGHELPSVLVDPTYDKLMAIIEGRS